MTRRTRFVPRAAAVFLLVAALAAAATAADPAWYVRKDTWPATLRASREARRALPAAKAPTHYTSPLVQATEPARKVEVDVTGWDNLWLIVTDAGDYHHDVSNWADAKLVDKSGKETWLDTLTPVSARQDFGTLQKNKSVIGQTLKMAGRTFPRGLGTHANSEICYKLPGKSVRFEAWVGIGASRAKGQGAVHFVVSPRNIAGKGVSADPLWSLLARDFDSADARRQMAWEREDGIWGQDWKPAAYAKTLALRYARATRPMAGLPQRALTAAAVAADEAGVERVRAMYYRARSLELATQKLKGIRIGALRLAIEDLTKTFGPRYPKGPEFLARLTAVEKDLSRFVDAAGKGDAAAEKWMTELLALRSEALLANPLLRFDKLIILKRSARNLGLPANWQSNSSLGKTGYKNELITLSPVRPDGKTELFYKPDGDKFVGDLELHWNADRMLFSMPGDNGRWQVFEIGMADRKVRQVTRGDQKDVDNYDACYLPDGKVLFTSTACFIGVPCVFGSSHVTNLYACEADGSNVRQLTFDQEHNWCPMVMPDGRVLYERWEYADLPHSQSRMLFSMNPDGTNQMEHYGSNSYWPNSIFYARSVPGHPTKIIAVISGHHGVRRMGELVLFDPARGRHEATGAVQRIPGHGKKVEPIIADGLVNGSWPKFLHPWPLNQNYFLVAAQPTAKSLWGIYLVDVFDNMLLLKEEPGYALLEPTPVRKRITPPVMATRAKPAQKDAVVYLSDVYHGNGLKGVPRGTVKKLRVYSYHFSYQGMGGLLGVIGMDGPWDIRRVVGTVPVEEDGSAMFRVPANTPLAVQPLDAEGRAMQQMRSWFTAMPGEVLSCVGCHERQNQVTPNKRSIASGKDASEIELWHGPVRGLSFAREVQPVLDKYCLGCHDGSKPLPAGAKPRPDLRGDVIVKNIRMVTAGNGAGRGGKFSIAYCNLQKLVRRMGIESEMHLLEPMEFHADTTQLVQMLRKGHHNVKLDSEAWDRIVTWIDMNAPYHGTWGENLKDPGKQRDRRRELRKLYAGIDEDPEAVPEMRLAPVKPIMPTPLPKPVKVTCPGWPFDAAAARQRQADAGAVTKQTLDLGPNVKLDLVLIPPGEFVMGSTDGYADEYPQARTRVDKPFWMARCEISNEQFDQFDSDHDSRVESKNAYQFGVHGYPVNNPPQPVVRVTWEHARAFCEWLSRKTGRRFRLPTEAQWEWACRAGSDKAFSFGGPQADWSKYANLADKKLRELSTNPYTIFNTYTNATPFDAWYPRDERFDDGGLLSVEIGRYQPNAFGLHDMHGNVFEWTRSLYLPYPYNAEDGRNDPAAKGTRAVRGGSWRDRPIRCRSAFRLGYQPWQRVYNVGFRVICEDAEPPKLIAARPR